MYDNARTILCLARDKDRRAFDFHRLDGDRAVGIRLCLFRFACGAGLHLSTRGRASGTALRGRFGLVMRRLACSGSSTRARTGPSAVAGTDTMAVCAEVATCLSELVARRTS